MYNREREYVTTYRFNDGSRSGSMDPNINIRAYHSRTEIEDYSRRIALSINHPNYVNCVGVDVLGQNYLQLDHFENFTKTMEERTKDSHYPPIRTVTWTGENNETTNYPYVVDDFRRIIRGMVSFLHYLHLIHMSSIQSLELDNFVIGHDDNIKYRSLTFIPRDDNSLQNDWNLLRTVLMTGIFHEYLVPESDVRLPSDLSHLLEMLENANFECENHLINHLSLMLPREKMNFFKACHDIQNSLYEPAYTKYNTSVDGIVVGNWLDKLKDPYLPKEVHNCGADSRNAINPVRYQRHNWDLMRCIRNLTMHLNHYFYKISDVQVESFISFMFLEQLLDFQHLLNINRVLKEFHIERMS